MYPNKKTRFWSKFEILYRQKFRILTQRESHCLRTSLYRFWDVLLTLRVKIIEIFLSANMKYILGPLGSSKMYIWQKKHTKNFRSNPPEEAHDTFLFFCGKKIHVYNFFFRTTWHPKSCHVPTLKCCFLFYFFSHPKQEKNTPYRNKRNVAQLYHKIIFIYPNGRRFPDAGLYGLNTVFETVRIWDWARK